jgi:hypothetical protein
MDMEIGGGKVLDLTATVYEICSRHPEAVGFLESLGFKEISLPGMLGTAGRFMTLPMGARWKKIDLGAIVRTFEENGYTVLNDKEIMK